jgi:hypothetical protein
MFMRSCVGVRLVQRCLDQHTTLDESGSDKYVNFPVGSMWEYIDDEGLPYVDTEGQVISDPGHAVRYSEPFCQNVLVLLTTCGVAAGVCWFRQLVLARGPSATPGNAGTGA